MTCADIIEVRQKSKDLATVLESIALKERDVPEYIQVNYDQVKGAFIRGPAFNEVPYPVAMEMALGFRFTAQRFHEIGFVNRLVPADALMPAALEMAAHLLTLPPASRVNTVHMMRQMRPASEPSPPPTSMPWSTR